MNLSQVHCLCEKVAAYREQAAYDIVCASMRVRNIVLMLTT
jgi:hypothetical protein